MTSFALVHVIVNIEEAIGAIQKEHQVVGNTALNLEKRISKERNVKMSALKMGNIITGVGLSKEAGTIAGSFKTDSSVSKPDMAMIVLTTAGIIQAKDITTAMQMVAGNIALLVMTQPFMGRHAKIAASALLVAIPTPGAIRRMEVGTIAE